MMDRMNRLIINADDFGIHTEVNHVQIPATSANVGSGFDALGIALTLFNDIYFSVQPEYDGMKIVVEGLGKESISTVFSENMVCQAMQIVADTVGKPLPGGTLTLVNRIPPARGLGSSSAAIVGGIVLADAMVLSVTVKVVR